MSTESTYVVAFTSDTCGGCAEVVSMLDAHADQVAGLAVVSAEDQPELHERYQIDGVPTTVFANAEGAVRTVLVGRLADHQITNEIDAQN